MNQNGQLELRHLLMGMRKDCKEILEYEREKDTSHIVYELKRSFNLNSAIVIYKNQLIITGGEKYQRNREATKYTYRFHMKIDPITNNLQLQLDSHFPNLQMNRSMHSAFVLNDHLFVMFGNQTGYEYYDLIKNPKQFTYKDFNEYLQFTRPLILPSEPAQDKNEQEIIILGENQFKKTRTKTLQFYKMQINLQNQGEDKVPSIYIEEYIQGPQMVCNFHQNYPQQYYYQTTNEWLIMNEKGENCILDLKNHQVNYLNSRHPKEQQE
ncbi:UNKNOWN [Stylonychia lemnae]|uniref:Kelch motif family protein n=1 Tax=Stylonychia lemnae TaxID=5949 RepID=A0A078B0V3_STYLE|nr:UNKNOWN [Stylonychia lemnae]|eukprot:CDW88275.1 UNKNOWN [Stylonychia lemnae]